MKIILGCSMKYRDLAKKVFFELENLGLNPIFPNIENTTEPDTIEKKKQLAVEHYQEMDKADAVYFILPNGYIGTSCKLELGYAFAKNIPIYFSEPTNDPALDWYAKEFISIDQLERFKNLTKGT